jgi:hypothetical protein
MLPQQGTNKVSVADVAADKKIARISIERRQVGWISRISQQIQVNDFRARSPHPAQNEV